MRNTVAVVVADAGGDGGDDDGYVSRVLMLLDDIDSIDRLG